MDDADGVRERVLAERQRRAEEAAAEEERLRLEHEEKLRLKHLRFNNLDQAHQQHVRLYQNTRLCIVQ